jgi:uncharacterized protein
MSATEPAAKDMKPVVMVDSSKERKPAVMAEGLGALRGKVLDTDSHAYLEPEVFDEVVGEEFGGFVYEYLRGFVGSEQDKEMRARSGAQLWNVKGISAFGAVAFGGIEDRVKMLDMTGFRAQFVYPNDGYSHVRIDSDAARAACSRYNDYILDWSRPSGGRVRPLLLINMHQRDWALAELERVLKKGGQGVLLPCSAAPAGVSPANSLWDPFWARLQEAKIPATLHIGSGGQPRGAAEDPVIPPREFADAESMRGFMANRVGGEEAIGPYFVMTVPLAAQLWVSCMVMGKVFERFPGVMLSLTEFGCGWVGPMCEGLDHHAELMTRVGYPYKMMPSEYVRQNVRVSPFFTENVALQIERHGLKEVYTFMSDFPHLEGGRDPIGKAVQWADQVAPDYRQQYLVDNATRLFPNLN